MRLKNLHYSAGTSSGKQGSLYNKSECPEHWDPNIKLSLTLLSFSKEGAYILVTGILQILELGYGETSTHTHTRTHTHTHFFLFHMLECSSKSPYMTVRILISLPSGTSISCGFLNFPNLNWPPSSSYSLSHYFVQFLCYLTQHVFIYLFIFCLPLSPPFSLPRRMYTP